MNITYKEKIRVLYEKEILLQAMAFFAASDIIHDKMDSELFSAIYLVNDNKLLEEVAECFYLSESTLTRQIRKFEKAIKYFIRFK